MKVGKLSGNVLKRSVLKPIAYKRNEILNGAGVGEDCAVFAVPDGYVLTSCVQEAAVAGKADMGLLIGRCANSLAAAGSVPIAAMIGLLLPESAEEAKVRTLMQQAESACAGLKMQIAGGHSAVSSGVSRPLAAITAYGMVPRERAIYKKQIAPGQDIVLTKWIGLEGTALLADRYRESLLTRYPACLIEEAAGFTRYHSILPEAAVAVKSGVCSMHDASEGGIFAALWELAESAGVGLSIDLKKLPIRQESVEVCEHIGANPYELLSGGCLILTARDGLGLVRALEEAHIPASIVGKITDGNDRLILNEDEVRYMDRPKMDEAYRLLSF